MQLLDVLDKRIYGASVTRWLLAIALAGAIYVALSLGRRFFKNRVARWAARTATSWDDLAVELIARTRWYFLLVVAAEIGAQTLTLRRALAADLRSVFVVAALLQLGVWGNGIIAFFAERYTRLKTSGDIGSRATVNALGYGVRALLWAILATAALDYFGIEIKTWLAGLGIGGIAVALAAQNVLGDLFAAIAIVLDRPFVVGDGIAFGEVEGDVEQIGLKTTRIRSVNGEQIVVANSDLLKSRVRNYGRMQQRRSAFHLDLSYDTPAETVARVPKIVQEVVEAQSHTRFDRCHFLSFSDAALRVEIVYFVLQRDYRQYADIQQAVNLELLRRFAAERIQFAYPARTVYLKGDVSTVPPRKP